MTGRGTELEREVVREIEARIEAEGLDLVDVEWAGSRRRPLLRVRIDIPGAEPGQGVTVDDCARVSRLLESWLDAHPEVPEHYVLEVSSPGVERPLVRRRDWVRFAGQRVAVRGHEVLADRATRLEGRLLGVEDGADGDEERYRIRLRLDGGEEIELERREIAGGNLVFEWS
jgi:ribosome maturation factor RimP